MNILFVTPRIPYPINTGAKIRTFNLLRQAKAEGHDVTLLSFVYGDKDREHAKVLLDSMGIKVFTVKGRDKIDFLVILKAVSKNLPITIAKYNSRRMIKKINELIGRNSIDLIHFDHLHMGQYKEFVDGKVSVLDEHNVESALLDRCADMNKNIMKRWLFKAQARKMTAFEARLSNTISKCLVVSDNDKRSLVGIMGRSENIEVVPNGVDTEYFSNKIGRIAEDSALPRTLRPRSLRLDIPRNDKDSLVFTGSMDWLPNSDAVEYFCKEILPFIWKEKNDAKFYVVGKNPTGKIREFGKRDKRIIVTGRVEDVRPYMANAKVFVAPLRIGGGTRLKILEAMSMQKAVVSTTVGAEGIAHTNGINIILADEPENFAESVLRLLDNAEIGERIGANGRKLVCEQYDWSIIGKELNKMYREAAKCRI